MAPAHLLPEQAQRADHLPTAINVTWSKAADGTFTIDEERRALDGDAGVDDRDTITLPRRPCAPTDERARVSSVRARPSAPAAGEPVAEQLDSLLSGERR